MPNDLRAAHLAMMREGKHRYSPAGLEYLFRLLQRSAFKGEGYRDVGAAEVCDLFRRSAEDDFGPFTGRALSGFGITTGSELGDAVFLLARHGCLALREGESIEEYAACGALGMHP
jgi:uncharacterized repeat protein (TIGR04138 family)